MTTIKCKQCGNEIEVTEALKKDIEQKIIEQMKQQHQSEMDKLKLDVEQSKEEIKQKAITEAQKAYESKIKLTKEEAEEREKRNRELQTELSDMMKRLRQAQDAEGRMKIEYEKRLLMEQEQIKQQAKKEIEEEQGLKMAEKDKKIQDMEKQVLEMKRKLEQGSQQTQGEVLELQLEERLRHEFPFDEISEVPKGIKGADVVQTVRSRTGVVAGTIVWESKNTKNWSPAWVQKLIEDQRSLKAELAILVSSVLPPDIKQFGQMDKIWVSDMQSAISLAYALRQQLIGIKNAQIANKGKETKAEEVYNYLISNDFRQRIEIWVEYFVHKQAEINKEKMYFTKKWEKDNKDLEKILENTAGMYGEIQGLVGQALPKINHLELPEGNVDEIDNNVAIKSEERLF